MMIFHSFSESQVTIFALSLGHILLHSLSKVPTILLSLHVASVPIRPKRGPISRSHSWPTPKVSIGLASICSLSSVLLLFLVV